MTTYSLDMLADDIHTLRNAPIGSNELLDAVDRLVTDNKTLLIDVVLNRRRPIYREPPPTPVHNYKYRQPCREWPGPRQTPHRGRTKRWDADAAIIDYDGDLFASKGKD